MNRLIHKGITPKLDVLEAKRIYFVNFTALLAAGTSLLCIGFYLYLHLYFLFFLCLIFGPVYGVAYALNALEKHFAAKTLLFVGITLNIFCLAIGLGNQVTMEVFYIPMIIILFMLYNSEEKSTFFLSIALVALVGVITFFLKNYTYEPFMLIPQENALFVNILFNAIALFGTILLAYFFVVFSESSLKKLTEKNTALQLERNQLYDTTIILNKTKKEQERLLDIKTKLLSIISHDVRQPVNNLLSVSDVLLNAEVSREELRLLASRFKESSFQVSQMLDNLMTWSYSQMNGLNPKPVKCSLKELTEKVVANSSFVGSTKKIQIETRIEESHHVYADPYMMEIVFRNILYNAIKFSPVASKVEIWTERSPGKLCLHIKDQGIGIPKEIMDILFINDLSKSRYGTSNEKGTGIGLLLCKQLMDVNKAGIFVTTNTMHGVTFRLEFSV